MQRWIDQRHFRNQVFVRYRNLGFLLVVGDNGRRGHFAARPRCGRHADQRHNRTFHLLGSAEEIIPYRAFVGLQHTHGLGRVDGASASHSNYHIGAAVS